MSLKYFQGRYLVGSARLKNWDYRSKGSYYITICTRNRISFFGKWRNGIVKLSDIGNIANRHLIGIPDHFDNVKILSHIIMPDHLHIIICLDKSIVETLHARSLPRVKTKLSVNERMKKISPKRDSLSVIIRSYKSAVSRSARKTDPRFGWQPGFHDRVIRNSWEMKRIKEYINNNPVEM